MLTLKVKGVDILYIMRYNIIKEVVKMKFSEEKAIVVGDRIRKARIKMRLTQQELGNKIGVSRVTINKYETGKIKFPTPYLIRAMEKELRAVIL